MFACVLTIVSLVKAISMTNKELIISIIQQDLKHCQLLSKLESIGLSGIDVYDLDLLRIVSNLMKAPEGGNIEFAWIGAYASYMDQAVHFAVKGRSDQFRLLAESCYLKLREIANEAKEELNDKKAEQ